MGQMVNKMQVRFKKTSGDFFTFFLKIISGGIIALTFALVVQELLGRKEGEGLPTFLFIIVVMTAGFMKISKKWSLTGVLIFDLIFILIGMILKLYILIAPGA